MIVKYEVQTVEGVTFRNDAHATRMTLKRFIGRLSSLAYKAGYTPSRIEVEVVK